MDRIALATGNKGKLAEFGGYLETLKIKMFQGPKLDFPPEDGHDYSANALIKARFGAKEWNVPCVGEDSGIEVAGLNNLPGPWSARFAHFDDNVIAEGIKRRTLAGAQPRAGTNGNAKDAENNNLILRLIQDKKGDARFCRYVACVALAHPNGKVLYLTQASVEGILLETPRGTTGFGFDPIVEFFDYPGRAVAELDMTEKNLVSHRGQAIQNLLRWLANHFA